MKKSSRKLITKSTLYLSILALASITAAFGADMDPNQLLAFKKIYVEPVKDNVDGAFREPVAQSYKDVFDRNPRFELVDSPSAADSVIKTSLTKKTSGIDVEISLVAKESDEIFSTDKTTIPTEASGSETGDAVKQLLKTTLKRIPFYGTITGRDDKELTFDIGAAHGLHKGDLLQVSRVDNIKRHPLLKTIVDAQLVPVGTAAVDEVEETIAFGHVHNEIAGEKIQKMHKITAVEGRLSVPEKARSADDESSSVSEKPTKQDEDGPSLGWFGLGVYLGSFSSSTSPGSGGTAGFSGSSFSPGVKAAGELWITKRWFADMTLGVTSFSYLQTDERVEVQSGRNEASASTRSFGFNFGYRYLPHGNLRGPQAFVKLGYYSYTFDVMSVAADLQSSKSYSGLNFGIGGSLPFIAETTGALLNFNLLMFPGLEEGTYKTGESSDASGVNFFVGLYHFLNPNLAVRAGISFDVYSADFDEGRSSTSQRQVGFLPSLLYYF